MYTNPDDPMAPRDPSAPVLKLSAMPLVPPDWANDAKGKFFECIAANLLKRDGYKVKERIQFTGMELDLIATQRFTHECVFVECKFRRETISANVIDILIGKSVRRNADAAFLFSASPPSKDAKGVLEEMSKAPPPKFPRFVFIGPETLAHLLGDSYSISPIIRPSERFDVAVLVLAPSFPPFWVLDQVSAPRAPLRIQLGGSYPNASKTRILKLLGDVEEFSGRPLEIVRREDESAGVNRRSGQLYIKRSGRVNKKEIDVLYGGGDD